MKIKSGVEQAVCILVILATQKGKQHVKSDTISSRINVSPSYLKKVMRKLVVGRLITSAPGNSGGFSLARSPETISMLDILKAIEGEDPFLKTEGLIQRVFPETDAAKVGSERLETIFTNAQKAYHDSLKQTSLAEAILTTLDRDSMELVDWNHSLGAPDLEMLRAKKS
ncbi:Rrf2 family transcriptional regulator [Bacillus sp. JCM 19046]|uniref:Rrf2 family protein n=1 Tax=Shouchella xiaoxiensis TaxID=766895 RepID=A0ABS2T044_9BACI|nr:Rrf2 family transcriptional regulator [Shouchella xiaoxiensis]MBM7841148.1 Rrf2 family protein [Shouchella xiaoxiensis]GAF15206.1 Rrf2 family transcriptional regulator [Bacillus sp. JCM 19045]GAF17489.1 Rrf2 family transcriptional regulator [Bacillus sp. JCM 19046]